MYLYIYIQYYESSAFKAPCPLKFTWIIFISHTTEKMHSLKNGFNLFLSNSPELPLPNGPAHPLDSLTDKADSCIRDPSRANFLKNVKRLIVKVSALQPKNKQIEQFMYITIENLFNISSFFILNSELKWEMEY